MLEVAVVSHILPHYRQAVYQALDDNRDINYTFYASDQAFKGIKTLDGTSLRAFVSAPFREWASFIWQGGAVRAALKAQRYDAIIYVGDPHFLSTWVGAAIARLRGTSVMFWAHGWMRREGFFKTRARNAFFRLATCMLVYGQRSARLGVERGYPAERIRVVYNSLDIERADRLLAQIESGALATADPRAFFTQPERPLVICTARLTPLCHFDMLIQAAALLAERGRPINVLLVGDGGERERLAALARESGVSVHFTGACYDEALISQYIYGSDVTVSPGKIGLTAMHSLMYGTPAITHDSMDDQMPEVEAIAPGRTGALFRHNDVADLTETLAAWLARPVGREEVRAACRAEIHARWVPGVQASIIDRAVKDVTGWPRA